MATRRPKKKKLTFNPDQEPQFERGDVVQLMGIPSPLMLVNKVSDKPRSVGVDVDEDDEDDDDEGAINASVGPDGFLEGEFMVSVVWFNSDNEIQAGYDGHEFPEGLLKLVKPASKVREDADASSREARGDY